MLSIQQHLHYPSPLQGQKKQLAVVRWIMKDTVEHKVNPCPPHQAILTTYIILKLYLRNYTDEEDDWRPSSNAGVMTRISQAGLQ